MEKLQNYLERQTKLKKFQAKKEKEEAARRAVMF